jgi:hypothetical protein
LGGAARAQTSEASAAPDAGIDHQNHLLAARARVEGRRDVIVLLAAPDIGTAATGALARLVGSLGGAVQYEIDAVGYLRAKIPVAATSRLRESTAVRDYLIDDGASYYRSEERQDGEPSVDTAPRARRSEPMRPPKPIISAMTGGWPDAEAWRTLTAANLRPGDGHVPTDEIGVPALSRMVAGADGRGVTVAVVEGWWEFTHPTLQTALTLDGRPVPKLAGLIDPSFLPPAVTAADSATTLYEYDNWTTAPAGDTVVAGDRAGWASVRGVRYHLPGPGSYHVGVWKRDAARSSIEYGVAWRDARRQGKRLWLDVSRRHDFARARALPDVNAAPVVTTVPPDTADGATWASAVAVAFDRAGTPHIYDGFGSRHTTMVASTIAGRHFLGSTVGGVAPGARLVAVSVGTGTHGMIEAYALAAADRRVDIITCSAHSESFPDVGSSFSGLILDRIVEVYGKPIFQAAANHGPAVGSMLYEGTAARVISVGAYVSQRSAAMHAGDHLAARDNIALFSGRGPARDGAMKPDLVAPYMMVTAFSCSDDRLGDYNAVGYVLPPCYGIGGGTSNATPFAAGAAALLISAAKLRHLPYTAATVGWALTASARALDRVPAYAQGAGLIQVDQAWSLLAHPPATLAALAVTAPVSNAFAPYLGTSIGKAGEGPGLYVADWPAGVTATRIITITRVSGPARAVRYGLRWRALGDGSFALEPGVDVVELPRNQAVPITVVVAPKGMGAHSAELEVIDSATGTVVRRVLCTVVVPEAVASTVSDSVPATAAPGYVRSYFVAVPAGAAQLRIVPRVHTGEVDLGVRGPLDVSEMMEVRVGPDDTAPLVIPYPRAGSWQVTASAGGGAVTYAMTIDTMPGQVVSTVASGDVVRRITGVADTLDPPPPIPLQVHVGTATLWVTLTTDGDTATLARRADLYVFRCNDAQRGCLLDTPLSTTASPQGFMVRWPKPGEWRIVVDPVRTRGAPLHYVLTISGADVGD